MRIIYTSTAIARSNHGRLWSPISRIALRLLTDVLSSSENGERSKCFNSGKYIKIL